MCFLHRGYSGLCGRSDCLTLVMLKKIKFVCVHVNELSLHLPQVERDGCWYFPSWEFAEVQVGVGSSWCSIPPAERGEHQRAARCRQHPSHKHSPCFHLTDCSRDQAEVCRGNAVAAEIPSRCARCCHAGPKASSPGVRLQLHRGVQACDLLLRKAASI